MNINLDSEPVLFTLFWTHFVGEPVSVSALTELWHRPRANKAPGGISELPIVHLIGAKMLKKSERKSKTYVAFDRANVSDDLLQRVLTAEDRFNWCFDINFMKGTWANRAISAKNATWYHEPEHILERGFQRHVFYRFGYRAYDSFQDYRSNNGPTHYGDGSELVSWARLKIESYRGYEATRHTGCDVFCDLASFPEDMPKDLVRLYRTLDRSPEDDTIRKFLRKVVCEEATALRAGTSVFEPEAASRLVAHLAAQDFLAGLPTRWALDRLDDVRARAPLAPSVFILYQALCFWNGERERLEKSTDWSPFALGHKHSVPLACALAQAGKFTEATKEMLSALGLRYLPHTSQWSVIDFPMIAILIVFVVISHEQKDTVVRKLLNVLEDTVHTEYEPGRVISNPEGRNAVRWLHRLMALAYGILYVDDADLPKANTVFTKYLRALVQAYDAKPDAAFDLKDELAAVRVAQEAGYLPIAADMLAIARMRVEDAGEDPESQAQLNSIVIDPAAGFAAPRNVRENWENVLDMLEQRLLPHTAKSKAAGDLPSKDIINWCLVISDGSFDRNNVQVCVAAHVFPILYPRLKNGRLGAPRTVSSKSFISGQYDELLSEDDLKLKSLLVGCQAMTSDYYARVNRPSVEALRVLSKMTDILIQVDSYSSEYYDQHDFDIEEADFGSLEVVDATFSVSYAADGGATIVASVPKSEMSLLSYVLKEVDPQTKAWRLTVLSKEYREMVEKLSVFGNRKSLSIPPAGMPRLETLLGRVKAGQPIGWAAAATLTSEVSAPRVATEPRVCVRLRLAEGQFTVGLAVRLSETPVWSSEPAQGPAERLVVRADGSRVVLTRDFAAETAICEPAREILKVFDEQSVSPNAWSFPMGEDALNALETLNAASESGAFQLEWSTDTRLDLTTVKSQSARVEGGQSADYWLSVSGRFELNDGKVLEFTDLLRAFEAREGAYVRLTDARYLKLSAALARRIEALKVAGIEKGGKIAISPAALPALERATRETEADELLPLPDIVKKRLQDVRTAFVKHYDEPEGLKCQMRPYQTEGYEWMRRLAACSIGACLADDMGLGKTVQLIALLLANRAQGASLVVAPASVTFNWRNEIARFAPSLTCVLVGQTPGVEEDVPELAKTHDVILTSYGIVTSRIEQFQPVSWNVIVLDEAQAIKNHATKRAKSVKNLQARVRFAATGTPIENRLFELWSLFDFLNPGMLGGETYFGRELAPGGEATPRLKRLVKPLILRRLKRDVLTDLPEKEEITVPVVMGDEERHAYEAIRERALSKLQAGDAADKLKILAELTRLRRFCCHPSLVMPSVAVSSKLATLAELLANLKANGHRALVFSQFVDYLQIVTELVKQNGWTYQYLDGSSSKGERERSVDEFQNKDKGDFFLISLKAGGVGLNLTKANYVILLDPWWNPAVENQAADRAHRIGQTLPVTVYRLICKDTIEEKVVNLHAQKTALAEDVLSNGAAGMTAEAMLELLGA